jgi:hypothetical protein
MTAAIFRHFPPFPRFRVFYRPHIASSWMLLFKKSLMENDTGVGSEIC